jgi:hypothetical protein
VTEGFVVRCCTSLEKGIDMMIRKLAVLAALTILPGMALANDPFAECEGMKIDLFKRDLKAVGLNSNLVGCYDASGRGLFYGFKTNTGGTHYLLRNTVITVDSKSKLVVCGEIITWPDSSVTQTRFTFEQCQDRYGYVDFQK